MSKLCIFENFQLQRNVHPSGIYMWINLKFGEFFAAGRYVYIYGNTVDLITIYCSNLMWLAPVQPAYIILDLPRYLGFFIYKILDREMPRVRRLCEFILLICLVLTLCHGLTRWCFAMFYLFHAWNNLSKSNQNVSIGDQSWTHLRICSSDLDVGLIDKQPVKEVSL